MKGRINMKRPHQLTAWILAAALLFAGCSGGGNASSEQEPQSAAESAEPEPSSEPEPEPEPFKLEVPKEDREKLEATVKDVAEKAKDKTGKVIAWLNVPAQDAMSGIAEPVMWYPNDLEYYSKTPFEYYYNRKNIYGRYDFNGCVFKDYEGDIGTGTMEEMCQNTILYGTHMGNPKGSKNDPNSDGPFSRLLLFRERDYAENTPYIFLTTEGGDLIYQVFAVSDVEAYTEDSDPPRKGYYYPEYSAEDFINIVDNMRERSYWDYPDVTVAEGDKLLTLSTTVYDYGNYSQNSMQRFVVMAKLVTNSDDPSYTGTARIEENTDRVLPPYAQTEAAS